ncbi:MAG: PspC domain-containing protein [Chloroflexales bacterium]
MNTHTRLLRSRTDRMIAGVAAGVARYLNTDPTIVRLVFVLLAFTGPGILIYPLLWAVMPAEAPPALGTQPGGQVFVSTGATQRLRMDPMTGAPGEPEEVPINNVGAAPAASSTGSTGNKFLGYGLLGLGTFIALSMFWPGFAGLLFPVALIAAGIWLLRKG